MKGCIVYTLYLLLHCMPVFHTQLLNKRYKYYTLHLHY